MKPRTALLIGTVVVVTYVVAVVLVYANYLGGLPFSRTSAEPWGQFGDYIGGVLNPLFALLNVIVVAYIALSVQQLGEAQRKQEQESERRIQTVVDLHREWNSGAIYASRTLAAALVRDYPSLTIFELEKEVPYEKAADIWVVIGFFQRLAFLAEHEKIHREMCLELFAELFVWWWVLSFDKQLLPCECDARDRILWLKKWIFENTSERQRAPWVHRAANDLAEAVKNASTPPFFVA
jgi:uncharacterized membrane protein